MSDDSSVPTRPTTPVDLTARDSLPPARPYRFTWDPASRRPGPESVSGTTEGRGGDDFADAGAPFTFLNPSSLSLALGSLPSEWSSSRTGFHAISTVLNNPHKRQAPPKAHSTLPSVPPAELPRVRRKDFDQYLRSIGPEWERYERNLQLGQEEQSPPVDPYATPRNSIAEDDLSLPPLMPIPSQTKEIPSLETVPEIFFQPNFHLSDPRTFAIVTEQDSATAHLSSEEDAYSDPLSQPHTIPLRDKFSHYVDTVEQHLAREISIRSSSFFAALTNLHDLQSESEQCLDRVSKLRAQLQDVNNNSALKGLEMVRKEYKAANLGKARQGVKVIHDVVDMTGVVKELVNAGQWSEALGMIEELEKLWDADEPPPPETAKPSHFAKQNGNGHVVSNLPATPEEEDEERGELEMQQKIPQPPRPPIVPLRSLHAFSALPSHLRQLTMQIAASLSSEFVQVLRHDLETRVEGDGKPNADADQGLRDRLKPLLMNLVRTKGLKEGMLSWREIVLVEVRALLRRIVPGFGAEEGEGSSDGRPGLANHMRSMEHKAFMDLIQGIYRNIVNCLQGLRTQGQLIVEVLDILKEELGRKVTDIDALKADLADILSASGALSNTQIAKIVTYRTEQHAALEFSAFLTFFNDSFAFVIKCERICDTMIIPLRGPLMEQAKQFLQAFHQVRLTGTAKRVEDEQWNPAEVTPSLQHSVDILVDSAVCDHPELIANTEDAIFSPQVAKFPTMPNINGDSPDPESPSTFTPAPAPKKPTKHNPKHLRIEERTFYVVSATTEVLTLLVDYLKLVVNLSIITPEIMSRVIEFLKAFNSRTCQVVLGAGAMRSAGLKNISAKHLALASQSLSVVFELIPYVRETFRRHLKQTHTVLLVEFDKLKRDYQEHQNEIHSKLVAIMHGRLNAHIVDLKAIDWNSPRPQSGVNSYMEVLVKETVSLHKILSRYLTPAVVEYVLSQVFADINHLLSEEYAQIQLPNDDARQRLLADAQYLHQHLSQLRRVSAPTNMLATVVQERGSRGQPKPNPPTRSNTLTANQRLKGLLSPRSAVPPSSSDKVLPLPSRTPSPPPVPPSTDKPQSPKPRNGIYGGHLSNDQVGSMSSSQLVLPLSPQLQVQEPGAASGFAQAGNGPDGAQRSSQNGNGPSSPSGSLRSSLDTRRD